jgi:hypothetical protein
VWVIRIVRFDSSDTVANIDAILTQNCADIDITTTPRRQQSKKQPLHQNQRWKPPFLGRLKKRKAGRRLA